VALYVYAITRDAVTPDCEAIDQSRRFDAAGHDALFAIYTPVSDEEFSQEAVDRRAGDLEWLGAIGYRHQNVAAELMKSTAMIPLRAFTLFSTAGTLDRYLHDNRELLAKTLERLDGKREWTLRVEFDAERFSDALTSRVDSLRDLAQQIEGANPGRAFLLRKKLDDEKKRASRDAEQQVVGEIESAVLDKLKCETVAESRIDRDGAFPQINVLLNRDEESTLQELLDALSARYDKEGVTVALTGPWPPYTFANG
jgi:Gas vesicle synthesis protein GvpL/GvpF